MVIMQWEEVWKLYKDCQPTKALYAWRYWYVWLLPTPMILAAAGAFIGIHISFLSWGWRLSLSLSLSGLSFLLLICITEKVYEREFAMLYNTHGLKRYPWSRRILALHYVRFVERLVDKKYTREDIVRLRQVAEIAERPKRPAIQFSDQPLFWLLFIVPLVSVLWQLAADGIKQADFWKTVPPEVPYARLAILGIGGMIVVMLLLYFSLLHQITSAVSRKTTYQDIQRFLRWAEHDIAEVTLLRARRLHAEMPPSQEP